MERQARQANPETTTRGKEVLSLLRRHKGENEARGKSNGIYRRFFNRETLFFFLSFFLVFTLV